MRVENFVPESLIEKYKSDVKAANLVNHLLEEAHAYIATASPRLFPEYTDHGPQHFRIVLETTRILIPDKIFEALSPIDIACLVCGTILHDLGMFISIQSLMALVSEKKRPIIGEIDSLSWSELWADHVNEVRQYSEEQCEALYGRTDQIDGFPERADDWTNVHCLCAGEFVRKYHPRMAHEIPVFGIPNLYLLFHQINMGISQG